MELFNRDAAIYGEMLGLKPIATRKGFKVRCGFPTKRLPLILDRTGELPVMMVLQTGRFSGNLAQREPAMIDHARL